MDAFDVRGGRLLAADVPASAIAERFGTPPGETGDFPARLRAPARKEGDLLAVHPAGAYGFVMISNDNTRGRAAEVLADSSAAHGVRCRKRQELFAGESLLPE